MAAPRAASLEHAMASYTKVTKKRRELRRKRAGRARKAQLAARGTTPKFPIHTPEADANAPAAQLSPSQRESVSES